MIKKFFLFIFSVVLIWLLFNHELITYALKQAKGQLTIVWNAEEVDELLKNPAVADSVKEKLLFIGKVRKYAIDSLGLNNTDNYTTLYDQKGEPLLWVVTGCQPYKLEAKEWDFPIVGKMPYKGFFVQEDAVKEFEKLRNEGYDVGVRNPGGWSTLGWFKDPILSNMLSKKQGDLAELIIHEMVHATVFVKDSVDFNENLASFIGERGAFKFLEDTYGKDSEEYLLYEHGLSDERAYISHFLRGADALEKLYSQIDVEVDTAIKSMKKRVLMENIMIALDTIQFYDSTYADFPLHPLPNNTYFMSFLRYRSKQDKLLNLFNEKFNKDLTGFILYFKQKHPFL
ncbi:aminopeptidase [Fulvivirga sediminis]|uniref:Aminopeptidase n=1 Tax=Fulvivirga sediminis TaxID=2803949 RepID=A0A937F7Y0_9BACT|nr:aminopeptidase [Fulvivirga sediminis]MBL3656731.1 aminopeptidase [Fulvivirga sediminis]